YWQTNPGLYMQNSLRILGLCAICLMGLALLSPLGAQSPPDQRGAEGCRSDWQTNPGLYMQNSLRILGLCAICLMGLALLSPLGAQSPPDQRGAEGSANIYNLDRDARVGGIEIQGRIGKAVANEAAKLIRSIRPDVDELTVFLSSPGGDR